MDDIISRDGETIMPQTSIQLDDGRAKAIEELKGAFGVTSSAGVVRRAIALARIAIRLSGASGEITLLDRDSQLTNFLVTV
jgi:hypothetical protein